jgi:hypothetical protein
MSMSREGKEQCVKDYELLLKELSERGELECESLDLIEVRPVRSEYKNMRDKQVQHLSETGYHVDGDFWLTKEDFSELPYYYELQNILYYTDMMVARPALIMPWSLHGAVLKAGYCWGDDDVFGRQYANGVLTGAELDMSLLSGGSCSSAALGAVQGKSFPREREKFQAMVNEAFPLTPVGIEQRLDEFRDTLFELVKLSVSCLNRLEALSEKVEGRKLCEKSSEGVGAGCEEGSACG